MFSASNRNSSAVGGALEKEIQTCRILVPTNVYSGLEHAIIFNTFQALAFLDRISKNVVYAVTFRLHECANSVKYSSKSFVNNKHVLFNSYLINI